MNRNTGRCGMIAKKRRANERAKGERVSDRRGRWVRECVREEGDT